jgi:hypothetical protein
MGITYLLKASRRQIGLDRTDSLASVFNRSISDCEDATALVSSATGPTTPANLSLERKKFVILLCKISNSSLPIVV